MEQSIGEVLQKAQKLVLSPTEILESYKHIPLTDDEITEAIIWAKRKKEKELYEESLRQRIAANRELSQKQWDFDMIKTFMVNRAKKLFDGKFEIDTHNEDFFNLLCYYFIDDNKFLGLAKEMGEDNPSLTKGLLIPGNFGTGKTWFMKLFQQNTKQTFYIRPAKDIAQAYLDSKDRSIPEEYLEPFKNPLNDSSVFFQSISGLCIDDLGSENKKNNYGNVMNVIGDLIEIRYDRKYTGVLLHGTTNMSADELRNFYGERVTSRMREIFNFVSLPGNDRRK